MKKYKATEYQYVPQEIEISRETKDCIFIKWSQNSNTERRISKQSQYESYFDTKEQAIKWMVEVRRKKIERETENLEQLKRDLEKLIRLNNL